MKMTSAIVYCRLKVVGQKRLADFHYRPIAGAEVDKISARKQSSSRRLNPFNYVRQQDGSS